MNKELVTEWIAALRSGQYSQTKNYLRDSHGFCCLGVLCDISEKGVWKEYEQSAVYPECYIYKYDDGIKEEGNLAVYYPSTLIQQLAGFEDEGFSCSIPEEFVEKYTEICKNLGLKVSDYSNLGFLNDGGVSFEVIADLLEILLEKENDN